MLFLFVTRVWTQAHAQIQVQVQVEVQLDVRLRVQDRMWQYLLTRAISDRESSHAVKMENSRHSI